MHSLTSTFLSAFISLFSSQFCFHFHRPGSTVPCLNIMCSSKIELWISSTFHLTAQEAGWLPGTHTEVVLGRSLLLMRRVAFIPPGLPAGRERLRREASWSSRARGWCSVTQTNQFRCTAPFYTRADDTHSGLGHSCNHLHKNSWLNTIKHYCSCIASWWEVCHLVNQHVCVGDFGNRNTEEH